MYTYGEEQQLQQQLCQVVQNLWEEIFHPEENKKQTKKSHINPFTLLSEHNLIQSTVRFGQHTSLTCMTLLNNSCPLNIALKIIKETIPEIF